MNPLHRYALLFVVELGMISGALHLLIQRWPGLALSITTATAWIDEGLLGLVSSEVSRNGNVLVYDGFAIQVILECVGTMEMTILLASIVALPTTWRKRAIGLLIGLPALYAFNVARVALLLIAGRHFPLTFDFFHIYLWQGTLILAVTAIWLFWMFKVVGDENGLVHP